MATFVLVPGAWLGGWVWSKLHPLLEKKGHSVYPVTLTGMGERVHLYSQDLVLETAIQDVLNLMKYNEIDDAVLVGHSFAGKIVAAVADRVPNKVKMILYLDAFRPEKGNRGEQGCFNEDWPLEDGRIVLSKEILDNIGKDVQGRNRKWMLSRVTPWPLKYALDSIKLTKNFDSIKSAYVFCTGGGDPVDEILQGKWGKLEGPFEVIESGHWPMITRPEELALDMLSLTHRRLSARKAS